MEIIRKYDNRKLYSNKVKKMVTLNYIQDLIKSDKKFIVINNSEEDITREVLKRVVLNLNTKKAELIKFIKNN